MALDEKDRLRGDVVWEWIVFVSCTRGNRANVVRRTGDGEVTAIPDATVKDNVSACHGFQRR